MSASATGGPADLQAITLRLIVGGRGQDFYVAPDLTQDAIWFLAQDEDSGLLSSAVRTARRNVRLKPYFQALLAKDPHGDLVKLLADAEGTVKCRALARLKTMAGRRRTPGTAAAPLMADADAAVATAAAGMVAQVGDETVLPFLRKAVDNPNPHVRSQAIYGLCRQKNVASLPAIAAAAKDMKDSELHGLAFSLQAMDSPEAVPLLLEILDKDPDNPGDLWNYSPAFAASRVLTQLTGIWFGLDAPRARTVWKTASTRPMPFAASPCKPPSIP